MNERIKELAERARYEASLADCQETYDEKFAELIVRDCRDMFVVNGPSWNLLNEKLEHLGVEE